MATLTSLSSVSMREAGSGGFARDLGESFEAHGFAIVRDHGLDAGLIARALAATKAFFALPEEAKRRYHVIGGAGQRGYVPFGIEAAKGADKVDLKEFWHVGRELPASHRFRASMPENLWPREIPAFRSEIYGLFAALDSLGKDLLAAIALYLGQRSDFFDASVRDGNSILRLLHYPPMPPNPEGVRAAAHEDINVITLLLGAEEAGLQLLTREGVWIDVNPPEGALVVNIGDMLQRLTNHQLPSTSHRVRQPGARTRAFAALFDPILSALRAGFSDRNAARLHHLRESKSLHNADQCARFPDAAPARNQAGLSGW